MLLLRKAQFSGFLYFSEGTVNLKCMKFVESALNLPPHRKLL